MPGIKTPDKFDPDEDLLLITDKKHPLYDPRVELPVDENLVLNIMVMGVIVPVLVRKDGEKLEVIDGRQRVKAAREANKRLRAKGCAAVRVPCVTRHTPEEADIFGVLVTTNELRQDDGPLEKVHKLARLLAFGKSPEECQIIFGITSKTFATWTAVGECSPKVQKAVAGRVIPLDIAETLSKLPREKQDLELDKMIAAGVTTGAGGRQAARSAVNGHQGLPKNSKPRTVAPMRSRRFVEKLVKAAKANHGSAPAQADALVGVLEYVLGLTGTAEAESTFARKIIEAAEAKS